MGDVTCYRMDVAQMLGLTDGQAGLTGKLMVGLGQEMATRLRIANRIRGTLQS